MASVPIELLTPIPLPEIPALETITDIQLGVLLQNDEKALEACNAKLGALSEILNKIKN